MATERGRRGSSSPGWKAEGLPPAPEADRATWLRRVTLDLTGLPPTPERGRRASSPTRRPDAYESVVDELLASPRYGERWAQHWLDVVRYADTHGFEVNTERPNAWPLPRLRHPRLQRRQALRPVRPRAARRRRARRRTRPPGSSSPASVLLPGQIGADEPSKRSRSRTRWTRSSPTPAAHVPRPDASAAPAATTTSSTRSRSATTTRCRRSSPASSTASGRCERRKPRQAAGGGGPAPTRSWWRSTGSSPGWSLGRDPAPSAPPVNARVNNDRFAPVTARRLRFTVIATNSLEPCLDELEVFDVEGRNVALAAGGTTVTSSGDTVVADRHELRHVNDGRYGNSRSWMSNQAGRGWVELAFPASSTIDLVVWGRDREGKYDDRLAVDYRIEVAADSGEWQTVADSSDRRAALPDATEPAGHSTSAGSSPDEASEAERLTSAEEVPGREDRAPPHVGTGGLRGDVPDARRDPPAAPRRPGAAEGGGRPRRAPHASGRSSFRRTPPSRPNDGGAGRLDRQPENPLTARVMVNRLWQGHFGAGWWTRRATSAATAPAVAPRAARLARRRNSSVRAGP